jgi:hypothetical protein
MFLWVRNISVEQVTEKWSLYKPTNNSLGIQGIFNSQLGYLSTFVQDGRLQRTYCSFNIGPYGKKCFKMFSSETSKPCHRWSLGGQFPKLCSVISADGDHSCHICFKLTYWFQRRRLLSIFSKSFLLKKLTQLFTHLFPI